MPDHPITLFSALAARLADRPGVALAAQLAAHYGPCYIDSVQAQADLGLSREGLIELSFARPVRTADDVAALARHTGCVAVALARACGVPWEDGIDHG